MTRVLTFSGKGDTGNVKVNLTKILVNVLLKLILLFSENLHITYFIKLLEKKYFPSVSQVICFSVIISKFKNKIIIFFLINVYLSI